MFILKVDYKKPAKAGFFCALSRVFDVIAVASIVFYLYLLIYI